MNRKWIFFSLIMWGILAAMVGCGGSPDAMVSSSGTRGDGSIPIGRARGTIGKPLEVQIGFEDGSKLTVSPEQSGIVRVPSSVPDGVWSVTVTQTEDEYPVAFSAEPKSQKIDIFDVTLLPQKLRGNVTGVSLGLPQTVEISVGGVLKLKPIISGTDTQGMQASFWTSGGIGKINPGGVFKALVPGTGTVTADVEGYRDSVTVVVVP